MKRIQFYVSDELFDRFYQAVYDRFKRTSGGAISKAGEEAIKLWLEKHGVKVK